MDSVDTPESLAELLSMHVGDVNNSFREIVRRHTTNQRLEKKFLTQNTFCMDATAFGKKPYAKIRAGLWGEHIKAHYDICLLQEIFENSIRDKLLSAWDEGEGSLFFVDDAASRTPDSSGLMTISKDEITGNTFHEFSVGYRKGLHLVDREADKGILLTKYVLDNNHGIELYNTHLDASDRNIRSTQLNEILTFITNHHENTNLAILSGDFNIGLGTGIQGSTYGNYIFFRDRLLSLGFVDAWATRNGTTGGTDLSEEESQKYANVMCNSKDPENPRFCVDENIDESNGDRRIDYIFIKPTSSNCPYVFDITRPRRLLLFNNLGSTTFEYMSDHIGIHTELLINRTE
ncbi:endonuclease/exonuclease/phosphatase family protein [Kordia jejudonensis]|uniref:endonuclease/exonuclease/phosphatase family protein n=1 Tax=Kordia jejudonensis TaxID=1348245 RepID=UPI00062999E0|nr:endonuclease/exonuclease/phosphatase family protein [Kordia jejudonensis]